MLLAKTKLDTIKFLISQALINSNISHDELTSKNMVSEYNEMKRRNQNSTKCCRISYRKTMEKCFVSCKKFTFVTTNLNSSARKTKQEIFMLWWIVLFVVRKVDVH